MIKQYIEHHPKHEEKKAQYAELVYDLIFVYIIGRNNALLHHTEGGSITPEAFSIYLICTLAVIQIWSFTTYFINAHYGKNNARDYILLFTNMFLMFFLARSTQSDWQNHYTVYHVAWALILLNLAVHYLIEKRTADGDKTRTGHINRMVFILLTEAVIVYLAVGEFKLFKTNFLSVAAILFGIIAPLAAERFRKETVINFEYLAERAMLYVVFTFGEMIIAIAGYFDEIDFSSMYFAGTAFLVVVGLLLSYGAFYDRIIDLTMSVGGAAYILIHVFLIFSLNNITVALEFMRDDGIDLLQKTVFLAASLLIYYAFLFALARYAKKSLRPNKRFYTIAAVIGVCYAALTILLRAYSAVNAAVTAVFVFGIYLFLRRNVAKAEAA